MRVEMDWKHVVPGLPGIVLLSHGGLSTGARDTVKLIYAEQENFAAVTLDMGDDPEALYGEIEKLYEAFGGSCAFFADFNGGTPCNQLRIFSIKKGVKLAGVLGFNIPMVLSAIDNRRDGLSAEEIAQRAIEEGRDGIQVLCEDVEYDDED